MEPSFFDITNVSIRQAVNPFILLVLIFVMLVMAVNPVLKTKPGRILFYLLISYFLMSVNSMLMSFGLRDIFINTLWTYFPVMLFIAPLCYFYVKSLVTENYKLKGIKLVHFAVPVMFTFFSLIVNVFVSVGYFTDNLALYEKSISLFIKMQDIALFYIVLASFLFYTFLSIRVYVEHNKGIEHFFSFSEGISLRWIRIFILGMIFYFLIFILSNNELFLVSWISDTVYDFSHTIITLFFIFLIGTNGVKQRNVFEVSNNVLKVANDSSVEAISDEHEKEKSVSSGLDESRKKELHEKMIVLFEKDKIYLNPSLTLDFIAKELDTNRSYVSQVINECFESNFYNLINKYRIDEAVKMLQDEKFSNYSIEGVANSCGFASRSSFSSSFKKFTGKNPSDYK
ncbi:MAG TPA: helix-turn-helix domain-containing protein [Bacteroidales bacterium]|nr:helix-turn-helix domain-containing protein [Bacteroidales bacterium]